MRIWHPPEMTNIGVLIDFLNPLGVALLMAMALISTVATVYELNVLTLYAVRIADQTPPTPTGPYREAFYRLANLPHPSTMLAVPFYVLLIPLVHSGATATPVPALTVPRYALEVLCATPLGTAFACLVWLLMVFCAMATMAVPVRMASERTCFLDALRRSPGDLRRMPVRDRLAAIGTYAALVAAGLLADACIPLKPLRLQDFNVYLLRYAVNSDLFRWRMALTVAQWLALAGATMVIAIMMRRAMDRPAESVRTVRERRAATLFDFLNRIAQARGTAAARRISAWAGQLRHRRIVAVILVLAMVWLMAMYLQQRPVPHEPIVIGHRGTATAAENSLQAISEAAAEGADVAEIDVQLTGADFVALEEGQFTTFFVEQAREMGVPVYVWTVNSAQRAEQYLETGAAGIITDEVAQVDGVADDCASDD